MKDKLMIGIIGGSGLGEALLKLGRFPEAGPFLYASTVGMVVLVAGWVCFRRASFRFAECI